MPSKKKSAALQPREGDTTTAPSAIATDPIINDPLRTNNNENSNNKMNNDTATNTPTTTTHLTSPPLHPSGLPRPPSRASLSPAGSVGVRTPPNNVSPSHGPSDTTTATAGGGEGKSTTTTTTNHQHIKPLTLEGGGGDGEFTPGRRSESESLSPLHSSNAVHQQLPQQQAASADLTNNLAAVTATNATNSNGSSNQISPSAGAAIAPYQHQHQAGSHNTNNSNNSNDNFVHRTNSNGSRIGAGGNNSALKPPPKSKFAVSDTRSGARLLTGSMGMTVGMGGMNPDAMMGMPGGAAGGIGNYGPYGFEPLPPFQLPHSSSGGGAASAAVGNSPNPHQQQYNNGGINGGAPSFGNFNNATTPKNGNNNADNAGGSSGGGGGGGVTSHFHTNGRRRSSVDYNSAAAATSAAGQQRTSSHGPLGTSVDEVGGVGSTRSGSSESLLARVAENDDATSPLGPPSTAPSLFYDGRTVVGGGSTSSRPQTDDINNNTAGTTHHQQIQQQQQERFGILHSGRSSADNSSSNFNRLVAPTGNGSGSSSLHRKPDKPSNPTVVVTNSGSNSPALPSLGVGTNPYFAPAPPLGAMMMSGGGGSVSGSFALGGRSPSLSAASPPILKRYSSYHAPSERQLMQMEAQRAFQQRQLQQMPGTPSLQPPGGPKQVTFTPNLGPAAAPPTNQGCESPSLGFHPLPFTPPTANAGGPPNQQPMIPMMGPLSNGGSSDGRGAAAMSFTSSGGAGNSSVGVGHPQYYQQMMMSMGMGSSSMLPPPKRPMFQDIGGGRYLPTAEAFARSDMQRGKGAIASVGGRTFGGGGGNTPPMGPLGLPPVGPSGGGGTPPMAPPGGGGAGQATPTIPPLAPLDATNLAAFDLDNGMGGNLGGSGRGRGGGGASNYGGGGYHYGGMSNYGSPRSQRMGSSARFPIGGGSTPSYFAYGPGNSMTGSFAFGNGGGGGGNFNFTDRVASSYYGSVPMTYSINENRQRSASGAFTPVQLSTANSPAPKRGDDIGGPPDMHAFSINNGLYVDGTPVAAELQRKHQERLGNENDLYSDDSVESDYDYDSDGNARTYYRKPKRSTVAVAQEALAAATRASLLKKKSSMAAGSASPGRYGTPLLTPSRVGGGGNAPSESELASVQNVDLRQSLVAYAGASSGLPLNAFYDSIAATRASHKINRMSTLTSVTERYPSVLELPENLRGLGKQIHKLGTEDLLYISSMVSRKAHREAYSVLQYTGKAWYLPSIRRIRVYEGEVPWQRPYYNINDGLVLTLGYRVLTIQIGGYILRAIAFALFWLAVWAALPQEVAEPKGCVFDPLITFVLSAVVGGLICRILQIPPLVGVLWIAIIYANIPSYGYLTHGILPEVKVVASRLGLTVVLLRAGYSTSWKALRPIWKNVVCLALLALAAEGAVHTALTYYLFDYRDWTWAALEGFMCSVPSAAIIVPGSLLLQSEGYSKTQGPLPLMLSTVGVETVLGVWVSSFINGIAVGGASIGMSVAMGPVQIVGGIIVGVALAYAFTYAVHMLKNEAKRMPNGEFSEEHTEQVNRFALVLFLFTAFAVIFVGYKYNLAGGACVAVMLLACVTAHLWLKDNDPELMEQKRALGLGLSNTWELLIMPFLFSMTGTKVDFKAIFNAEVFPKGLLLWICSVATRMIVVFFSSSGLKFNMKEKLYACGSWAAKATVQSALAGVALTTMNQKIANADPNDSNFADLLIDRERAQKVQNVAILFVILSAPTAATWITKLGPKILTKE